MQIADGVASELQVMRYDEGEIPVAERSRMQEEAHKGFVASHGRSVIQNSAPNRPGIGFVQVA